jgi:two-component system response regulator
MKGNPAVILLVEDDDAHALLTMRSFEDAKVPNRICWVKDGEEALDYLFHRGRYTDKEKSPRPDLILLDLRLPKLDGHEVLRGIKKSDVLKHIPVVVLTTSESEADLISAYGNHVNSYLVKPIDFGEFSEMIRELGFYWLIWNKHPWKD